MSKNHCNSFPVALERLLLMMEGLPLPVWSSVVVVEVHCEKGVQITPTVPAGTYDARFQEILDLGYADSIRLGVSEVKDGALVVEVVFYSSPDPGFPDHRHLRHAISVAMHGPTRAAWNRMGIDPDADLA